MTNSNSKEAWAKYLAARLDGKTVSSDLGPGDTEKQQAKDGHHNEAKNIIYEQVTLQSSQSLSKE